MSRLFVILVRLYRAGISPFLPAACRFYPSCSHYAEEAILRHGWHHGLWLALRRLLRCRPYGPHGFDPVP